MAEGGSAPLKQNRVACNDCSLAQLCLPMVVDPVNLEALERIIKRRRPLKRGEHLFQMGAPFQSIYAVRSGSIKTYAPTEDGQEQVAGFHLPGELIGLDAIQRDGYPVAAKVLETTSVCELPFAQLDTLCDRTPTLQRLLRGLLIKELGHQQEMLMLLGKKSAEERLAGLLVNLASRYSERGLSDCEFHLSMSRNDIANYLGLAVETVSRLFTRFQEERLLFVQRKHVRIRDMTRLKAIAFHDRPGQDARGRSENRQSGALAQDVSG